MPRAAVLPHEKIKRLYRDGLTQQEIARRLIADGDVPDQNLRRLSQAVGMARLRMGLSAAHRERHDDLLPWVVREEHRGKYAAKMLRLEGQRRSGSARLAAQWERKLDAWLKKLEQDDTVVHYEPETEQGFWYVRRRYDTAGNKIDTDLIRDPKIKTDE